jgi:hypothetical protein
VGLVNNLGTGVKDFFYEPWDALESDASLEAFVEGIRKGEAWRGGEAGMTMVVMMMR